MKTKTIIYKKLFHSTLTIFYMAKEGYDAK
jgi:hypothetical protein